ncbi:membrane protein [Sporosarcina luteola]|uniref:Membrane protein n=1 Tax=Sporosarcina luteola TaxID=582850 RepID=A0A511Z382_9BACL|nr:TRAP transporter small permease [Sporosarcina luteola]GEN81900.1 membrane protein [Sporosarcina luteola]
MKLVLTKYMAGVDSLNRVIGWILAIMISLMSIFIFWQVLARKVLGSSLSWSEEISRFLMVWVVLLGAAYALKKGELIAVELLPELLSEKGKKILLVFVSLFSLVFYIILTIYGWEITQSVKVQIAPGTGLSMFWVYLALPAGGILFILNTFYLIIEKFMKK